jgi:4-hydroxy-3-methylbut-2-en-1-yl diphosphate synthase IspG/GcpE
MAPDPMLPEGPWHEQVRRGAARVARYGMGLEWTLTLETIPHFLRATYGATLEGLAYTASRLVELCREVAMPGVIVSLDMAQPVAAYRFLAAHLESKGLAVPLHVKHRRSEAVPQPLFQGSVWLGDLAV